MLLAGWGGPWLARLYTRDTVLAYDFASSWADWAAWLQSLDDPF